MGRRKLQSWHVGYIGFFHAGQSWRHSKEIEAMIEKNKKGKRGQGKKQGYMRTAFLQHELDRCIISNATNELDLTIQ